jgi:predicted permease
MSDLFVSPLTATTIVVGAVIAIFYLRNMWLVLQRTAETLDEPEDKRPDAFAYSFAGAVVAVVASWLAIAAYGLSPIFLYVGVVLALASPIAVGYTFYRELRD